jgi:hypothetical protein
MLAASTLLPKWARDPEEVLAAAAGLASPAPPGPAVEATAG